MEDECDHGSSSTDSGCEIKMETIGDRGEWTREDALEVTFNGLENDHEKQQPHREICTTDSDETVSIHSEFSCTYCGFRTLEKKSYEAHLKAHSLSDFFRCVACNFTSNNTTLFRKHRRTCPATSASKAPPGNPGEKDPAGNAPSAAPPLSSSSSSSSVLDARCYVCSQCGRAYASFPALRMHEAYHSTLRPFACDLCDYRFFSESSLRKHSLTHEKINHLECPYCSFKCSQSGSMTNHMRTHTGEKPYICGLCPYRTANPSTFKRHTYTHNNNKPEYRCPKCNYKTYKHALLLRHQESHTPGEGAQCHICHEKVRNYHALRYHMSKTHEEQEVLECPFCDFRQKDKALLTVHVRRHTGEKPYGCPEENCFFRGIRSQGLRRHLRKCHGKEKRSQKVKPYESPDSRL